MRKKMKDNKEWKNQFRERLLDFSVSILKVASKLPKAPAGFAIANQIVRSGTSVGANFEEAQDASSMRDFLQKLSIALREAKETYYWLKVIKKANLLEEVIIEKELVECNEIVSILVSCVKSAKLKLL